MSKILFIQYPKCGTCQKASKWLKENNIDIESRSITEERPSVEELSRWAEKSALPLKKLFNTSGKLYKEKNLKEVVKTASDKDLLTLLATDGMLVKRPILVTDSKVLVGFDVDEWSRTLKK